MTHDLQDAVSLELARRVAARLRASPALLETARAHLTRWIPNAGHFARPGSCDFPSEASVLENRACQKAATVHHLQAIT